MSNGRQAGASVVVVGGGIAGLCAANNLAERGASVLLLERNPISYGGRLSVSPSTTVRHGGRADVLPVEHGIHGFWRQYRNLLAFIERAGLSDALVLAEDQALFYRDSQRFTRVNVGRRTQNTRMPEPVHHLPLLADPVFRSLLKPSEIKDVPVLGQRVAEILAFDPCSAEHRGRYDGRSVQSFLNGMPFVFKAFLRSLTRSGFFSDPHAVSLWAFLLSLQLYVFLRREDQQFRYLRGSMGDLLCDPLVRRLRDNGGEAARGIEVERVERAGSAGFHVHWRAVGPAGERRPEALSGERGTLLAPMLVLAVDVEAARSLAETSPAVAEAVGDLSAFKGRPSTAIRLWFGESPSRRYAESGVFAGRFTADNYFWLHRFQDCFREWHQATGGGAVECHVYAPERLHRLDDEVLLERVQADIEAAFPEVAGSCVHRTIVRNAATHINFPVGCAKSFPTVQTPSPDLVLAGDWVDGGAPVLYMERACQTGVLAANKLLGRLGLPQYPVLLPEAPPRHVQLIQHALRRSDRVWRRRWS